MGINRRNLNILCLDKGWKTVCFQRYIFDAIAHRISNFKSAIRENMFSYTLIKVLHSDKSWPKTHLRNFKNHNTSMCMYIVLTAILQKKKNNKKETTNKQTLNWLVTNSEHVCWASLSRIIAHLLVSWFISGSLAWYINHSSLPYNILWKLPFMPVYGQFYQLAYSAKFHYGTEIPRFH